MKTSDEDVWNRIENINNNNQRKENYFLYRIKSPKSSIREDALQGSSSDIIKMPTSHQCLIRGRISSCETCLKLL